MAKQQKTSIENKCGGCTLCCKLLEIKEINKPANQLCTDCILNKGCGIYKDKPQSCTDFQCAYYQMDRVSKDLRPDNCKVIFEKVSGHIFFGTQDPDFPMTEVAIKQIGSFNREGYSVVIATKDRKDIFLAQNHTPEQIKEDFDQYLKEKYGRT